MAPQDGHPIHAVGVGAEIVIPFWCIGSFEPQWNQRLSLGSHLESGGKQAESVVVIPEEQASIAALVSALVPQMAVTGQCAH